MKNVCIIPVRYHYEKIWIHHCIMTTSRYFLHTGRSEYLSLKISSAACRLCCRSPIHQVSKLHRYCFHDYVPILILLYHYFYFTTQNC